MIRGGDAERDAHATLVSSAALRTTLNRDCPSYRGATELSPLQAGLAAVLTALEMASHIDAACPLLLRLGDPHAAAIVAGTWAPSAVSRLGGAIDRRLQVTRRQRHGGVWIAGYPSLRPYGWAERAEALAAYGRSSGFWGDLPPTYASASPRAPAVPEWVSDDHCPVCLDAYTDEWPSPDPNSRAPPGRWACRRDGTDRPVNHAVCRSCDARVQRMPRPICPLCRADRRVFMQR